MNHGTPRLEARRRAIAKLDQRDDARDTAAPLHTLAHALQHAAAENA